MSFSDVSLCSWCGNQLQEQFVSYNGEYICCECYERRNEEMDGWKQSLDRWLTTPPDDERTELYCDDEDCHDPIYPGDEYYVIEGMNLCRECALKWLDERAQTATEEDCYGPPLEDPRDYL